MDLSVLFNILFVLIWFWWLLVGIFIILLWVLIICVNVFFLCFVYFLIVLIKLGIKLNLCFNCMLICV